MYSDVQRLAEPEVFQRYDLLLAKKSMNSVSEFRRVIIVKSFMCRRAPDPCGLFWRRWCKSSRCGSGQIHEGGDDNPIMRCTACSALVRIPHSFGLPKSAARGLTSRAGPPAFWGTRASGRRHDCGLNTHERAGPPRRGLTELFHV